MTRCRERAREPEHGGDAGRIVEGRPEPAVVMRAHDDWRAGGAAGQVPDDVVAGRGEAQIGVEHEAQLERPRTLCRAQFRRVLLAHRHERRRAREPVRGERSERALGLVEGPALRAVDDDAERAAQAQLEGGVTRRSACAAPVEQRDAIRDVEAVEQAALARADVHERREHPVAPRRRRSAHRGAGVIGAARDRDSGIVQPPAVDRHGLDRDLREPDLAHLGGHEICDRTVFRRPRGAEPEGARADRREPLDDVAKVDLVDLGGTREVQHAGHASAPAPAREEQAHRVVRVARLLTSQARR